LLRAPLLLLVGEMILIGNNLASLRLACSSMIKSFALRFAIESAPRPVNDLHRAKTEQNHKYIALWYQSCNVRSRKQLGWHTQADYLPPFVWCLAPRNPELRFASLRLLVEQYSKCTNLMARLGWRKERRVEPMSDNDGRMLDSVEGPILAGPP
jgi:hypothetical protein